MTSTSRRSVHVPVMPREVLQHLQLSPGLTVLDGTAGAGGHSSLILKQISPGGCLIAFDRDPMMLKLATDKLESEAKAATDVRREMVRSSYINAPEVLKDLGIDRVDRVLLDLGLSSDQLADRERGFGFDAGGPLDMRFFCEEGFSAGELLAKWSPSEMADVFRTFGEEPAADRLADEIVRRRTAGAPVRTTEDLEDCYRVVTASGNRTAGREKSGRDSGIRTSKNPATRVFQALRIATNQELQHVELMISAILPQILNVGGIAVILTFHSLEDRIIKNAMKGQQGWHVLTKTPLEATPAEIRLNPRSRSAKLRAVQRI